MYSMSAFLNRRDQSRFGDQKSFFTEPKKIRKLQVKVSRCSFFFFVPSCEETSF